MSYDIRIWSSQLPDIEELAATDASLPIAQGRSWLINASGPTLVEPEDVPQGIAEALPGIRHLVELTLEPIGAPAAALAKLRSLAKRIATAGHGAIEDPQTGLITLGSRVERLSALGASEDATLLSMHFWYDTGALTSADTVPEFLDLLSQHLPEALPARYGEYEPPQFRLQRDGRGHLDAFMRQHWRRFVVYYPSPPVAHLHLSLPETIGPSRQGYRCGHLAVEIDVDAVSQPGWHLQVIQAWHALIRLVQPFYSDVRQLRHYSRTRGRYWVTSTTERHPICSWWWSGVPTGSVYAVAIGAPYLRLWPEFATGSRHVGSVALRTTSDWRNAAPPLSLPDIPVPIKQIQPEYGINTSRVYPETWPFAPPRV